MDQCRNIEANAFVAFEEMRGYLSISDRRDLVACPKPRRVGLSLSSLLRSQFSHCSEANKNREGADLLDLILKKEDLEFEQQSHAVTALMTPFYGGSPPCRADNPLAQDAHFRNGVIPPIAASPVFSPSGLLPSPSPPGLKGCVRMKFGPKPAAVRVEGFDCLSRDGQNSSVPAIAQGTPNKELYIEEELKCKEALIHFENLMTGNSGLGLLKERFSCTCI